jgi:hypothetical protein
VFALNVCIRVFCLRNNSIRSFSVAINDMILRIALSCLLSLISLLPYINAEVLPSYHCGIGPVSKVASFVVSLPCGREKREF